MGATVSTVYTSYYNLSPCSSPPVRMGILGATQIIYCLVHWFICCFGNAKGIYARLSQCKCAFGHALWSIFKARRAILLLGVHSLDSKTMRDELPCEIYACECLPITFFAEKASGSCLGSSPSKGENHHLGRFLGHDPRGLRWFLTPSTNRDLGFGTDNFYQLDSASTRSDYA